MKKNQQKSLNRIASIEDAEEFDFQNDNRYEKIIQKKDRMTQDADVFDLKKSKNLKQSKIEAMLKDFEDVRQSLRSDNFYN